MKQEFEELKAGKDNSKIILERCKIPFSKSEKTIRQKEIKKTKIETQVIWTTLPTTLTNW